MRPMPMRNRRLKPNAGFTVIELLVVAGIIGIIVAVSLPAISRYIRNYRITGAARSMAGEMQAARARAISRNATYGVVLLILSNTTYRYVIEDDMQPNVPPGTGLELRKSMTQCLGPPPDDAQLGPLRTLPVNIQFLTPGAMFQGVRFNNLGAACQPGSGVNCPVLDAGIAQFASDGAGGGLITLVETTTGLTRNVLATTGGRIFVQ